MTTTVLPRCLDKEKRLNLKGKRKRNLIKKAIELSQMLDMEMCMVFRDIDTGKISLYSSGSKVASSSGRSLFSLEKA